MPLQTLARYFMIKIKSRYYWIFVINVKITCVCYVAPPKEGQERKTLVFVSNNKKLIWWRCHSTVFGAPVCAVSWWASLHLAIGHLLWIRFNVNLTVAEDLASNDYHYDMYLTGQYGYHCCSQESLKNNTMCWETSLLIGNGLIQSLPWWRHQMETFSA